MVGEVHGPAPLGHGAVISGHLLDVLLIASTAGLLAALSVLLMRRWRPLCAVFWVGVICVVPYWVGVTPKVFIPPATLAAVLIVLALLPVSGVKLHAVDALVLLLVVGFAAAFVGGTSILSVGATLLVEWVPAYVVGRLLATSLDIRWMYGVIAVGLTIVAVLALLEFLTSYNPFVHIAVDNTQFQSWAGLQTRGGQIRAEGAFGHSIALGASLGLAVPLAIGSRFRPGVKVVMVGLMSCAAIVTFSRIGMATCVLGVVLSMVFLRGGARVRTRVFALVLLVVGFAVAYPAVGSVFADAGSEATNSASYRVDLVSLVRSMRVLGLASSFQRNAAGQGYFSDYRSIDSELVLLGLTFGLLVLALVVIALIGAVVVMLRGRATPATVAIVAQIPAFATVALITQYAAFVWFVAGVAVTSQLAARPEMTDRSAGVPTEGRLPRSVVAR